MEKDEIAEALEKTMNGYAFPGRVMALIGNNEQEVATQGLTKREYMAIHCNVPIPDWFTPVVPERPKRLDPPFVKFGKNYSSDHPMKDLYSKYWNDAIDDWEDPEGIVPEQFKAEVYGYIDNFHANIQEQKEYDMAYNMARLIQWPVVYADCLLKQLNEKCNG